MGSMPDLGPVWSGGKSVLNQKLTHNTSGIPCYPAFDDAFSAGTDIIAPEKLKVVKASSSNPGDAFYAEGDSKWKYWFGHLVVAPAVGKVFSKGQKMGDVLQQSVGGGSHCHVGINVEAIMGAGKQLKCGANGNGTPEYTYYSKTVGEQMAPYYQEANDVGYPDWFWDWNNWYLNTDRDPKNKPAGTPDDIPDWAWAGQEELLKIAKKFGMTSGERDWIVWYNGGKKGERPNVYEDIPDHWWKDQEFVHKREGVAV